MVDNNDVNECYELLKNDNDCRRRSSFTFQEGTRKLDDPEIKNLLKERRSTKHDLVEFKNLDKLMKSKCICAYEEFLDKKCDDIEALYQFNPKQAHKRMKKLKRKKFTNSSGVIKDKNGTILFEENGIKRRWLEYVKELYDEAQRSAPSLYFKESLNGPTILKSEIQNALSSI